jgi:DNA-binding response OmpR family regulator
VERRIMVVDDEAQVRQMLSDFFQEHGFTTASAATVEAARRLSDQSVFDLVLLDIAMAGENGLDLVPQFKQASPNTRVLVLTGLGYGQELLSEALQKGADGYVTKDLPLEELLSAVNRTLSS